MIGVLALIGFLGWKCLDLAYYGIEAQTQKTNQLLNSSTVDKFTVNNATKEQAVDALREAIHASGVLRTVTVKVMTPDEVKRDLHPRIKFEEVEHDDGTIAVREKLAETAHFPDVKEPRSDTKTESLALDHASLSEVAEHVTPLWFSGKLIIRGREIRIYPFTDGDGPLVSKTLWINPGFESRVQPSDVTSSGTYDIRRYLEAFGVQLCQGSRAEFHPGTGELHVVLPQTEIDLLEASGASERPIDPSWWQKLKSLLHL